MDHSLRAGRFTSSKIAALMSNGKVKGTFGKPALTYIKEKLFETKLGRRLDNETNARATSWGNLVEDIAFEQLSTGYKKVSQETIQHPTIENWSGSPDLIKYDDGLTVGDIKCPMTLKSFCTFYECENIDEVREMHDDGEKYYWQLVSNSILLGTKCAELIIYVPYQDELETIREAARNYDGDQNKIAWINWANDEDLPYLIRGIYYKNIKVIRFEVPQSDKDALTERVNAACKELKIMLDASQKSVDVTVIEHDKEVDAVLVTGEILSI